MNLGRYIDYSCRGYHGEVITAFFPAASVSLHRRVRARFEPFTGYAASICVTTFEVVVCAFLASISTSGPPKPGAKVKSS